MKRLSYVLVLLLWVSAASATEWELVKDSDGVQVYTRTVEGSAYKEFRGETVVEVELNRAMALIDDTDACGDWMHQCRSPALIRKLSPLRRYTYMVNDLPWPTTDRALLLQADISQNMENRQVTVTLNSLEPSTLDPADQALIPTDKKAMMVEQARGQFVLTPLGDERTQVEYRMLMDPGGSLPASLVNAVLVDTPFHTLKNMQSVVRRPAYRDFRPF